MSQDELARKQQGDRLKQARERLGLKQNDYFVNAKELNLRELPNANSKVIGVIGACSYVFIMDDEEKNGFVLVDVSEHVGYVKRAMLVDDLDKITVESESLQTAKEMYFVSYESKQFDGAVPIRCNYNGNTLFVGPEGGCFYLTKFGTRKYIDRKYCGDCD